MIWQIRVDENGVEREEMRSPQISTNSISEVNNWLTYIQMLNETTRAGCRIYLHAVDWDSGRG